MSAQGFLATRAVCSRIYPRRAHASHARRVVAMAATTEPRTSIAELLSSCVDAARKGCDEIRAVQERRAASGALASTRKDADDPRSALTEADTNAQRAIVNALKATWPTLNIVGEEEDEPLDPSLARQLKKDVCDVSSSPPIASWTEPTSSLTVFVDPVDGTREFVEGRLEAVQCLIGVAFRGRAVGGVVGLPFPENAEEPIIVWGVAQPGATSGVSGAIGGGATDVPQRARLSDANDGLICVTGDSKNESLAVARESVRAAADVVIGGAGNKILALADGRADVALMHFGTSLWDTCAPEAVLRARGGKITDLLGAPLVHDPSRPGGLINDLGVLATSANASKIDPDGRDHAALAATMRADPRLRTLLKRYVGEVDSGGSEGAGARASDIARCLRGAPVAASWVGERIVSTLCGETADGEDAPFTLAGYVAPEEGAFRGLMSDACRLELHWEGGDAASGGMPATAFYKKVVLGDLDHARTKAKTAPLKLSRDVGSAAVEAGFLACPSVLAALNDAGVRVPRCFDADLRPCDDDLIESKFALLLEDFAPAQGWKQERLLTPSQARASLTALAKMHATFMPAAAAARVGVDGDVGEDELLSAVTGAVWPSGAYWQPDMQPAEQMTTLKSIWNDTHLPAFKDAFKERLPELGADVDTIGERLQDVAVDVGAASHPFGPGQAVPEWAQKWKTLIHGDAKSANIFLREDASAPEGWEVGLIDFQWMGFGLGAVDAAHVLLASVDPQTLGYAADDIAHTDPDAPVKLMDHYHVQLCEALAANGAAASAEKAANIWTREETQRQYEAAVLDFCRVIFAYQWVRVKASPQSLKENESSMNKNSYNKSIANAMWVVKECDAVLKKRAAA